MEMLRRKGLGTEEMMEGAASQRMMREASLGLEVTSV